MSFTTSEEMVETEMPGKSALYLPERLIRSSLHPLPADKFPPGLYEILYPPDSSPISFFSANATLSQSCKPLHATPLRTVDRSQVAFTKMPEAIQNLGEHEQLHTIKRSRSFWENLKKYTEIDSNKNTWSRGRAFEGLESVLAIPSVTQQAAAISGLLGWLICHSNRRSPLVNSEMGVHDEVHAQLLIVIDLLLQARFFRIKDWASSFKLILLT